ncbi:MAG TPA: SprB repeat-containing protein, partial [Saprospiraceae bacterium]|nr:SprB repeat-containing protein [Saprospiraceae bacterium]
MRLPILLCFPFLLATGLQAQVTLLSENFNGCALPSGWTVNSVGNQAPTWSVGISQNNDAPGQSIDGSCFLFIDDESEGNNTAGYTLSFTSPAFNASLYTSVELTMDVHYRDWDGVNDYLEILVTDGTAEKLVSRFDNFRKNGATISEHFSLKSDLALLTQSATARLIIRYNDGNGTWAWWAGVDNIKITGSGTGTNVIRESFNGCAKPAGWETQLVSGANDWKFGLLQQGSNALQGGNSMDGTCFAYFDDDANGNAPSSVVRLSTPWIDGSQFANFYLNYDVILRYYKEKIRVIVKHASGAEFIVRESNGNIGGPYFPDYVHETFDISPYRATQMRIIFEFNDGNDWGWWAGVDNVKVTGSGVAHDLCSKAVQLTTGAACTPENNISASFEGPVATCADKSVAGLWYTWQAGFSGTAKFTTHAKFNDVVSVFTGGCASPQLLACNNRDEHGFIGETTYFPVQSGTQYLIRVSGADGGFGVPRGDLCVEIAQGNVPTLPANDNCATAAAMTVNGNCTIVSNANATMSPTLPSLNLLARADLWYTFTAGSLPAGEKLEIQSNASFSDIITLYSGGCGNLQEVASNHKGSILELPALTAGQNYWVQIAGNFATIEGSLCPQLIKKQANAPANDDCVTASAISLGAACAANSNLNAIPSAYVPSCVQSVERDVWFSFTAPPSGTVHLNSGADFEHALAVWQGSCNSLTQVFCAVNPLRCDGFVTVNGLVPGQTYYVQIASRNNNAGDICLKIINGANPPDFLPLAIDVVEECTGQDTAELQVTVSGGVQPYTFSGDTDGELMLSGENYLVVVTDANGCEHSVSGVVDACNVGGCALTATLDAQQPKCFDAASGALTALPAGGATPYQYHWSNNATTASITGLPAGIYSVTITDAAGCITALSQTLIAPAAVAITPSIVQPKCFDEAGGSISTTVTGGTPAYGYQWSNNATTASISNLAAGVYLLTVTDANGCTGTTSQTLTDPDPLTISPFAENPKC